MINKSLRNLQFRNPSKGLKTQVMEIAEVEIDTTKDNVRVFFSNLEFNVTTQDLITTFPEIKIVNFEMIMNPLGKSRGFG